MFVRKAVSINGLRAALASGAVARVGELACIDVATGLFRPAVAGAPTLRPFGTFTENLTGDGVRQTYVASPNELRAQEWLNDTTTPVVMPTHRGSLVFMLDAKTVTADDGGGANAPAGVALDIDNGGRVIVQPPIGLASAGGGASAVLGVGEFVFADFGTQDEAQGRYTSWTDLMAKLATIQFGAAPVVRCAFTTGPFTVPLAGMPANGWDFRGGHVSSFFGATGVVVLDCPPGVKLDNLFSFGGETLGQGTVVIKIAPPPGTGVLEFTALPPGAAWIHVIGGGSFVDHSTDTGAYMRGDNTGRSCVMVTAEAMQNAELSFPLSGPLVELGATDGAVGVQWGNGGLPTGWLAGGGPGSDLLNFYDDGANPDTDNLAVWCPGFTGGGVVTSLSWTLAKWAAYDDAAISPPLGATNAQAAIDVLKLATKGNGSGMLYTPAYAGDWDTSDPPNVQAALDRLANAVAGLLGTPIP